MGNAESRVQAQWGESVRDAMLGLSSDVSAAEVDALRQSLATLAWAAGAPRASAFFQQGAVRSYSRHLILMGPQSEYSVLLIAWPPNHVTPLHDHSQLWGIELVLDGTLLVDEFTSYGQDSEVSLAPVRSLMLAAGDATTFVDAGHVHRCRNLSATQAALSLHVYGGVLEQYRSFHPERDGRLRTRVDRTLSQHVPI